MQYVQARSNGQTGWVLFFFCIHFDERVHVIYLILVQGAKWMCQQQNVLFLLQWKTLNYVRLIVKYSKMLKSHRTWVYVYTESYYFNYFLWKLAVRYMNTWKTDRLYMHWMLFIECGRDMIWKSPWNCNNGMTLNYFIYTIHTIYCQQLYGPSLGLIK